MEKIKEKTAKQIRDAAVELLDVYSRRQVATGFSFTLHQKEFQRFRQAFPFEETLDQTAAINDLIKDMTSSRSMDRLVCGDVGFGKTEVAMQAAFIAVQNNKQVAVLVPTTLLAEQHVYNFHDRFADWPRPNCCHLSVTHSTTTPTNYSRPCGWQGRYCYWDV